MLVTMEKKIMIGRTANAKFPTGNSGPKRNSIPKAAYETNLEIILNVATIKNTVMHDYTNTEGNSPRSLVTKG